MNYCPRRRWQILERVEPIHEAVTRIGHVSLDADEIEEAYRSARGRLISRGH